MGHVHSWRRLKKNTFLCGDPTCYTKMDLEMLHGKLVKCLSCGVQFIMDTSLMSPTIPSINCGNCFPGFPTLTLEEQEKRLTGLVKSTYEDFIVTKTKEFESTQKELDRYRMSLEEQNARISKKQSELLSREEVLARKAALIVDKIKQQRKKYKEEYNKTLISYRESERRANLKAIKQEKLKQSQPVANEVSEAEKEALEKQLFEFISQSLGGNNERPGSSDQS